MNSRSAKRIIKRVLHRRLEITQKQVAVIILTNIITQERLQQCTSFYTNSHQLIETG